MTPEAMVDLANKVLFADWQRREAEEACQAKGTTFAMVLHEATVGRALAAWGTAMQWFIFKCVTPNGRTDGHFAYVDVGDDGGLVCSFCKEPLNGHAPPSNGDKERGQ